MDWNHGNNDHIPSRDQGGKCLLYGFGKSSAASLQTATLSTTRTSIPTHTWYFNSMFASLPCLPWQPYQNTVSVLPFIKPVACRGLSATLSFISSNEDIVIFLSLCRVHGLMDKSAPHVMRATVNASAAHPCGSFSHFSSCLLTKPWLHQLQTECFHLDLSLHLWSDVSNLDSVLTHRTLDFAVFLHPSHAPFPWLLLFRFLTPTSKS